jgi:tripeptide aminopeptidase
MNNDPVVSNFLDLVQIDSPSGREGALAEYLISRLKKSGLIFKSDSRGNLFARNSSVGDPVLLCAHLDTVEPGIGINPQIIDGVIGSDGNTILGADNKAALAAILTALESVDSKNQRPLEIIFSVEEETKSGIKDFDFTKLKSKSGLIADRSAPLGGIVTGAPWILNLNIYITGKGVHASRPEQGINAISIAAAAIKSTVWGRYDEETTTNIGLISGGSAMNSVPESVTLIGEIRSFQKKSLEKAKSEIQSQFQKVCKSLGGKLVFDVNEYCIGYLHNPKDPEIIKLIDMFNKLGLKPYLENVYGASDANAFNAHGIKVVTIADGGEFAHTVRESVKISDLNLLLKIFQAYITS